MTPGPVPAFELLGVTYLRRALALRAEDLGTLRAAIAAAPPESLFLHTQLPRLSSREGEAPGDEFSAWVRGVLQDGAVAERLAFAVQSCRSGGEPVRAALLSVLDHDPSAGSRRQHVPEGGEYVFIAADAVVLPTGVRLTEPAELLDALAGADRDTWFHHLVAEPWFVGEGEGLFGWLDAHGGASLRERLAREAASGRGIAAVRARVLGRERRRQMRRRVVDLASRPPAERGAAARDAALRLARRFARGADRT